MYALLDDLTKIAFRKTTPFCYGCYLKAPTGKCQLCGSDDLMRELPGVGVEYGVDWVIRELIREHLTPANTCDSFEASVTECYPETVKIGWIEYETVAAIKELDPVSWKMAHSEYVDSEVDSGNLVTFDSGDTHYWLRDVEQFVETNPDTCPDASP